MTGIEVIALIVALMAIVKIIIFYFNKNYLARKTEKIMKNPGLTILVLFVLGIIIFGYVLDALTIVQVFAGIALYSILVGLTFAAYPGYATKFTKDILKEKTPLLVKLVMLVWLILSIWVLIEVLG